MAGHDWIKDVIADLKEYAEKNQLTCLQESLAEANNAFEIDLANLDGEQQHLSPNVLSKLITRKIKS